MPLGHPRGVYSRPLAFPPTLRYNIPMRERLTIDMADLADQYEVEVRVSESITPRESPEPSISLSNYRFEIASDEYEGHVDLREKKGSLKVLPKWADASVSSFVKNVYTVIILQEGGLVLHAAAVVKDGKTHIFFGPSESGKTTIAELSSKYQVLTDEAVGVRRVGGLFRAYGLNSAQGSIGLDVSGLFKLVKDSRTYVNQYSISRATAELLTLPKFYDKMVSAEDLVARCADLAAAIPCYELHFKKDRGFWRCIDGYNEHMPEEV